MPVLVAKQVRYFGQVQGVGFRRRTEALARALPVVGDVCNLPDGSVVLHAEGDGSQVDELLKRVRAKMGQTITEVREEPATLEGFDQFTIRR